jgi:hypothetical protein
MSVTRRTGITITQYSAGHRPLLLVKKYAILFMHAYLYYFFILMTFRIKNLYYIIVHYFPKYRRIKSGRVKNN